VKLKVNIFLYYIPFFINLVIIKMRDSTKVIRIIKNIAESIAQARDITPSIHYYYKLEKLYINNCEIKFIL